MSRKQRRHSRRRQEMIDAAREIIAQKGVAGLTVQDITEAVDMAVGSFYTYFPTKEALIEAAIWEDLQQLGDPNRPCLENLSLDERRQAQLLQAFEFVEAHRDLMQAVFGPGRSPEHYERAMTLLEARTLEGLKNTTPLPEAATEWIVPLIAGLLAGGIRYFLLHPDATAQQMTERITRLMRPLGDHIDIFVAKQR